MKILVTGGAGFIGLHTVELLLNKGHEVTVLDDFSTGDREALSMLLPEHQIFDRSILQSIYFGTTDYRPSLEAYEGVDAILHLAAKISVQESVEDPFTTSMTNLMGMIRVLECARKFNIKRVVFASSAAVYGDLKFSIATESLTQLKPLSPYGLDKLTNEAYAELFSMQTIGLRYFNIYGPGQVATSPYSGVISKFCERSISNQDLRINGDGWQTRNFIYVGDVAKVNVAALEAKGPLSAFNGVVNVGSSADLQVSINQLAATIIEESRSASKVVHGESLPGDIKFSNPDLQKFAYLFQDIYPKMTPLNEGIKHTLNFLKQS